jgi:hypothetical protein
VSVARHRPRWQSIVSVLLLTAYVSACAGWHTVGPTPEAVIREQSPRLVRLTFTDRLTTTLRNPALSGDSVSGELASSPIAAPERLTLPLGTVTTIAVRRTNGLKTAALIAGGVLLLGVLQCAATQCLDLGPTY